MRTWRRIVFAAGFWGVLIAAASASPVVLDFRPEARVLPFAPAETGLHRGRVLSLYSGRPRARSFDRWVEVLVDVDTGEIPERALLRAEVYGGPRGELLAADEVPPDTGRGFIYVDLRALGLPAARLRVLLVHDGAILDNAEIMVEAEAPGVLEAGERIAITLDLPEGVAPVRAWPVTFGVPFPAGVLWNTDALRLVDGQGRALPFQAEPTGRWAREGALKWVRFDALVDSTQDLFLEILPPDAPASPPPPVAVRVRPEGERMVVDTGAARYILGSGASPIHEIRRAGRTVVSAAERRGLYVVDQHGRMAQSADLRIDVETEGPVSASLRMEGAYRTAQGEELARHITRFEFYAGRPEARVTHTLVLTRDSNEVWFREIGWELGVHAGAAAQGLFHAERDDREALRTLELSAGEQAWLLQEDYVQFGGGERRAVLGRTDAAGAHREVQRMEAMGDWAVLAGASGGLLLSCRDAARQHPKELRLSADGMTLLLFSPRAGEMLDFRAPGLVQRWNRGGLLDRSRVIDPAIAAGLDSNAIGWAKTHEILLYPFAETPPSTELAQTADRHGRPLYAHTDPRWIYRSRALGPLYPRDDERFAESEAFIEEAFAGYLRRGHEELQEYGFIDYFAGPHYRSLGSPGSPRYRITYSVRMAAWTLYARSMQRVLRLFAEGTNRRYLDNHLSHWDGGGKLRGLYVGADGRYLANLPFYWESRSAPDGGGGPNSINQFLWDYHLTGYRRAGEVAAAYAAGMKAWWTPGKRTWYRLKALRNLTLAYEHTWDPELLPLIEDYLSMVYDPQGEVFIEKDGIPNYSTYKIDEDLVGLIEAARIMGDARLEAMSRRLAALTVYRSFGTDPLATRFEKGRASHYLYEQTGDLTVVEEAARALRQALAGPPVSGISHAYPRIMGLPYLLALVAEHDADRAPVVSWAHYEEAGAPTLLLARKPHDRDILTLRLRGSPALEVHPGAPVRSRLYSSRMQYGLFQVRIPRDAEPVDYLLLPRGGKQRYVLSAARTPLVLFAPGPWRPLPTPQVPSPPIFFRVPEAAAEKPALFFEGQARLFAPDGTPWREGAPQEGWIELPADRPGLWSFVLTAAGRVETRDIPPFFAFGDAAFHFEPQTLPDLASLAGGEEEDD